MFDGPFPFQENCLSEQRQDTYPWGSWWWNVEILHGRLPRHQSGPRARAGDEPALHCLGVHAAHLGEVHPLVNKAWLRCAQSYCFKIPSAALGTTVSTAALSSSGNKDSVHFKQYTCEALPPTAQHFLVPSRHVCIVTCPSGWELTAAGAHIVGGHRHRVSH